MDGKELSATLAARGSSTPDVIAVIASGEETGKLPESLITWPTTTRSKSRSWSRTWAT